MIPQFETRPIPSLETLGHCADARGAAVHKDSLPLEGAHPVQCSLMVRDSSGTLPPPSSSLSVNALNSYSANPDHACHPSLYVIASSFGKQSPAILSKPYMEGIMECHKCPECLEKELPNSRLDRGGEQGAGSEKQVIDTMVGKMGDEDMEGMWGPHEA